MHMGQFTLELKLITSIWSLFLFSDHYYICYIREQCVWGFLTLFQHASPPTVKRKKETNKKRTNGMKQMFLFFSLFYFISLGTTVDYILNYVVIFEILIPSTQQAQGHRFNWPRVQSSYLVSDMMILLSTWKLLLWDYYIKKR